MDMTFASLMVRAGDEPDAMYGLAAKSVRISPDKLTYRFAIRPEARFHDGSKLTAHDVAFSLNTLKEKGHPLILVQLRDFVKAEALDDATVVVTFAPKRARDVPLYVAGLPIFSKAYYATRPFDESTLDTPLGSGPYKVGKYEVNRYIEYRARQGLVGGRPSGLPRQLQFRYRALRVLSRPRRRLRRLLPARIICSARSSPRASGPRAMISRRSRTAASSARPCRMRRRPAGRAGSSIPAATNSRIRACAKRIGCAFDFEWTNKTVMYGAYARTCSPFQNSDMVASGPPSPEELKLLEPFRGQVPDEVFGEPFVPPVSDGSGQDRTLLRKAQQLLQAAGLPVKDGKRLMPNGELFKIEFLLDEPSFQPHHATFIKNLGQLGIEANIRLIDAVQYRARVEDFRFRRDHRAHEHVGDAGRWPAGVLLVAGRRDQRARTIWRGSPVLRSTR